MNSSLLVIPTNINWSWKCILQQSGVIENLFRQEQTKQSCFESGLIPCECLDNFDGSQTRNIYNFRDEQIWEKGIFIDFFERWGSIVLLVKKR